MANEVVPYSATATSIFARIIFMYLLYTKRSTNNLSFTFCLLNITSSSLWMKYSLEKMDMPLLVRSIADVSLFAISAGYIARNKWLDNRVHSAASSFSFATPENYSDSRSRVQAEPLCDIDDQPIHNEVP